MTRSRDVADTQDNLGGAVAPFVAGKNAVINGGFDVWQRGTSFAVPTNYNSYTADRFVAYRSGLNTGATISRQLTNDTTNLPNIQYCLRYQRDSGNTATGDLALLNGCETANSIQFAGKVVSFSFYARAGANYSATSNLLQLRVDSGTGTDQNIGTGYGSDLHLQEQCQQLQKKLVGMFLRVQQVPLVQMIIMKLLECSLNSEQ